MAPVVQSCSIKKSDLGRFFKSVRPTVYSESSPRSSTTSSNAVSPSWSATGASLATCSGISIRIWNPERAGARNSSTELRNAHPRGGVEYGSIGIPGEMVDAVSFCPTRENVLASTGADNMVRVWDVRLPSSGPCGGTSRPASLAWSPDGNQLLVCARKGSSIAGLELRCLSLEKNSGGEPLDYMSISFSNSGAELFAPTAAGPVALLDWPSGKSFRMLRGLSGPSLAAVHSPLGGSIAVGCQDSIIALWDTRTFFCVLTMQTPLGGSAPAGNLSYSFDGQYLCSGSASCNTGIVPPAAAKKDSGALNIYWAESGEIIYTVETQSIPTHVAWHPNQHLVAYTSDSGLRTFGLGVL
ncbi:WD40 repeat-like protein [Piedraia hortae CBS 480.64]|uniref:WD40 repeat-like protein n=1 Tax=Piedraia hortae CBS 480.64 TaxID=1314780 RepID=A0A6A7BWU4_9PEZI|nr:WD40 repeat-like protein [Piedraia hortae CBS 480.64]